MRDDDENLTGTSGLRRWAIIAAGGVVLVPLVLWVVFSIVRSQVTPPRVAVYQPAALADPDAPKVMDRLPAMPNGKPATAIDPPISSNRRAVSDVAPASSVNAAFAAMRPSVPTNPLAAPALAPAPAANPLAAATTPPARSHDPTPAPSPPDAQARQSVSSLAAVMLPEPHPRPQASATAPIDDADSVRGRRSDVASNRVPIPMRPPAPRSLFDDRVPAEMLDAGTAAVAVPLPPRRPRVVAEIQSVAMIPVPRPRPFDAPPEPNPTVDPLADEIREFNR